MLENAAITIFLLVGLLLGSFANVVIWRFPRGESVVSPGSHCPACDAPVRWFDNIPVLSWVLLRARCRDCGAAIPARYPLVEALSGLLWLSAAIAFGLTPRALLAAIFFWVLLILTFIDLDTMRLPNPIVGSLAVLGAVAAAIAQFTAVTAVPLTYDGDVPLVMAGLGLLLGGGLSGAVAGGYALIRGRSGFGMGDVKLLGAMGLFIGPYVLLALMAGSLVGAVYGVVSAARASAGLTHKIPFGPFLALGGIVTALFGPVIVQGYLSIAALG